MNLTVESQPQDSHASLVRFLEQFACQFLLVWSVVTVRDNHEQLRTIGGGQVHRTIESLERLVELFSRVVGGVGSDLVETLTRLEGGEDVLTTVDHRALALNSAHSLAHNPSSDSHRSHC